LISINPWDSLFIPLFDRRTPSLRRIFSETRQISAPEEGIEEAQTLSFQKILQLILSDIGHQENYFEHVSHSFL
jgi:hypothetical protein